MVMRRIAEVMRKIAEVMRKIAEVRVAEVEGALERRSPKGQGFLRKEGPRTYANLSRNLV